MMINKFSKRGIDHKVNNRENQDYVDSIEGDEYLIIMLADGASGCEKGLDGARLSCEAIKQIIQQEGTIFFNYSKEKIAYLLIEHILYVLECNQSIHHDIKDYGSTFSLVFMEKKTGKTVFINLGDSAIIHMNENGFSYVLKPKRYQGHPCLTTTKGANQAIDIKTYQLALGDRILICSDGFLDQMNKNNIALFLNSYDLEALNQQLAVIENQDDCSYITFMRERK